MPEVFRKEYHVLGIKGEATLSLQLKDSTLTEEMKLLSDKDSAEVILTGFEYLKHFSV